MVAALVFEGLWAVFVAYWVHHAHPFTQALGWQYSLLTFFGNWATPAIAGVVVIWLIDAAAVQLRR